MTAPLRRSVVAIAAAVLVLSLAACVNGPTTAASWLRGQPGILSVQVVDEDDNLGGSTGTVRGELDPGLSDEQLTSLASSVAGFLRSQEKAGIRLGIDAVDFWVEEDDASNRGAIELWRDVVPVSGVVSGIVAADSVHVRALRPDMESILTELGRADADLRIEGFPDAGALEADESEDAESGDDIGNVASLEYSRARGCEPSGKEIELAVSLFGRDEIAGALLDPCLSFDIHYADGVPFSTALPALQEEIVTAGLEQFPVTADQQRLAVVDGLDATVTPIVAGDPAMFSVFAAFEVGVAMDARITLYDDRSVEITDYEVLAAELVAIVQTAPAAAASPFIRIEGSDVAVGGLAPELAPLAEQAAALQAISAQFTSIELNTDAGILALSSPVATDPDLPAAVRDLRASQVTAGRTFIVTYLQTQLTIVDGVASVSDDYTDGHVVEGFAELWNAGG